VRGETESLGVVFGQVRVVVVDDQADFRAAAREFLERRGHVVVGEAANCGEALAAISRTDPELVLMDVRLGNENGLDATRAVTSRWPNLAVLLMSVDSSASAEDVRASGASAYVAKTRLHVADLDALVRPESSGQ
jgi:DNA-binding NarL/FixJ family response regulator